MRVILFKLDNPLVVEKVNEIYLCIIQGLQKILLCAYLRWLKY